MNRIEDLAFRLQARKARRAVTIRSRANLGPDPERAFGIAALRLVTEDQIQALAFGTIGTAPQFITRLDPMGRDTSDLIPFANWLVKAIDDAARTGDALRIWVPHGKTLEMLRILGRRYANNKKADPILRRAAAICRNLTSVARSAPDQQLIVNAHQLLLDHVSTGQSPLEDQHLGALLAWINPPKGMDVYQAAEEAAMWPAASMLANIRDVAEEDNEVEQLRLKLKKARKEKRPSPKAVTDAKADESKVHRILGGAVEREWTLLTEAREAFLGLALSPLPDDEEAQESLQRQIARVAEERSMDPRRPLALQGELEFQDGCLASMEHRDLRHDDVLRAVARRQGRVLGGTVVEYLPNIRSKRKAQVRVITDQIALRLRKNDSLSVIGPNEVSGVISDIKQLADGNTEVLIVLKSGMRVADRLSGQVHEWISQPFDARALGGKTRKEAQEREHLNPLAIGNPHPKAPQRRPMRPDLLDLAQQLRTSK